MTKTARVASLLREGGHSAREIASLAGCTTPLVYEVANRIGIEVRLRPPKKRLPEPRFTARPTDQIRADLARQLERIVRDFDALLGICSRPVTHGGR